MRPRTCFPTRAACWRPWLFFPDDDLSHSQLRQIIASEYESWSTNGPEDYTPSGVTQALPPAADKRTSRVYVCGLVALALFGLHCLGKCASQEKAFQLVSNPNTQRNKFPFETHSNKVRILQKKFRLSSDPSTTHQILGEYRSAAHIAAARVVCVDYLEPLRPFESTPEADQCFLLTVAAFQDFFVGRMEMTNWNLCLIDFPESLLNTAVPFHPTTGLMEAILGAEAEKG